MSTTPPHPREASAEALVLLWTKAQEKYQHSVAVAAAQADIMNALASLRRHGDTGNSLRIKANSALEKAYIEVNGESLAGMQQKAAALDDFARRIAPLIGVDPGSTHPSNVIGDFLTRFVDGDFER